MVGKARASNDCNEYRSTTHALADAHARLQGLGPFAEHGWRRGIVTGLGKNRGNYTVVHLSFETGGKGRRVADELWWAGN